MNSVATKIAIFDSGFGGLSVLNAAINEIQNCDFIYFADSDNAPYGVKSSGEILELTKNACEFLIANGADIIVLACNTATSAAAKYLRQIYQIPIIGMEPAIKPALKSGNAILAATPATIKGQKLSNLIAELSNENSGKIELLALPKLVEFAQKMQFNDEAVISYLKAQLSAFDLNNTASFVLGCTHFNYFKDSFRAIFNENGADKIRIIDGISGTIKRIKSFLDSGDGVDIKSGDLKNSDANSLQSGDGVSDNDKKVRYFSSYKELDFALLAPLLERLKIMQKID